jgi:hypothetical protein
VLSARVSRPIIESGILFRQTVEQHLALRFTWRFLSHAGRKMSLPGME